MKVKKEKKETKKEREKRLDKEFAEYLRALSPKEGKWLMNIAGLCLERFRKMENMEHLSQSQRSEEFGRFFAKVMKAISEKDEEEVGRLMLPEAYDAWKKEQASLNLN